MKNEKMSPASSRLRELAEYTPRFDFEQDPSEFYSLVEWYAKVMFRNFEETMKSTKKIRRAARRIQQICGEGEIEGAALVVRRGLKLTKKLDDMHRRMCARHEQVLGFASFSHDLSDELECFNLDLISILRDLNEAIDGRSRKPRHSDGGK